MASLPDEFELFNSGREGGIRILELGAGTGLLSILCRKLLDLHSATRAIQPQPSADGTQNGDDPTNTDGKTSSVGVGDDHQEGLVVSTDFLPEVLDNLKICVDLNFPSPPFKHDQDPDLRGTGSGIHIAKLDWTTFPSYMQSRHTTSPETQGQEETSRFMDEPFDLVLASDCVYDPTHADLLRRVASWVLRLPDPVKGDKGGTFVS